MSDKTKTECAICHKMVGIETMHTVQRHWLYCRDCYKMHLENELKNL